MRNPHSDPAGGRQVRRLGIPALLLTIVASGCDSGPAELVRDLDAAREGCTEEMLKAADEECVRMFETYADMAAGAMESYIGGMRAFDEAVRRRGGLQFDTAGLGHALGEGLRSPGDPTGWVGPVVPAGREPGLLPGGYDPMSAPYYPEDPYYSENRYGPVVEGGRWSDPVGGLGGTAQPYPRDGVGAGGSAGVSGARAASPSRRGVLLPPEERLQRPWIDDGSADDRYVPEGPTREPALPSGGQAPGWYPDPYAAPGAYPYGAPGTYPYPYGAPGGATYPYGGTGSAYPYPPPGPGMYPYPDNRSGSW